MELYINFQHYNDLCFFFMWHFLIHVPRLQCFDMVSLSQHHNGHLLRFRIFSLSSSSVIPSAVDLVKIGNVMFILKVWKNVFQLSVCYIYFHRLDCKRRNWIKLFDIESSAHNMELSLPLFGNGFWAIAWKIAGKANLIQNFSTSILNFSEFHSDTQFECSRSWNEQI